jgi:beta-glucosidase
MASFPSHFAWGVATASYQIEGAVNEDGRGESIWDRFCRVPGAIANGATGDIACDHYHRWRDDLRLLSELGVNAYRFSVAWPRILPEGTGTVNSAGLDFYDRLVDALLEADITPWVTLYHWDLPQALEDRGGWPNRATAEAFAAYADLVARRLGDRVRHWITLNEPSCSSLLGYFWGIHAPGRRSLRDALRAAHTLLLGHGLAVAALRASVPAAQIGIAQLVIPAYPASDRPADLAAAHRFDGVHNRWFLDPIFGRDYPGDMRAWYRHDVPLVPPSDFDRIAAPLDFLGVNHYFPVYVADDPTEPLLRLRQVVPPGAELTAMEWIVQPAAFFDLLLRLQREYAPAALVVTENGAAYADPPPQAGRVSDPARVRYLAQYLAEAARAVATGLPLRGYFVWTLMDNFEWNLGYSKRFGLYYTDYPTQARIPKDSSFYYQAVVRTGRVLSPAEWQPPRG